MISPRVILFPLFPKPEGSLFHLFPLRWSAKTMRGSLFPLFLLFWWPMSIHPVKTWTTKIGEIRTLSMFSLGEVPKAWEGPYFPYFHWRWNAKTMRGSLFPLFSGPIFSSCQDMGHQNRGNRDPLMVLALHPEGNHERDPLSVFLWWSAKTMKGSLFPLFWWPMSIHPVKTWTTKIGEIGEIGTPSWFWHLTLRGNRGNRGPLSVFPWWSAKTMKGSLFPLFWWRMSWQDDTAWTTKIGEIGEIGTLSWFWHFTLRGNMGNRDPLMVLEESRFVCGYVLTFFGDWLVHASDVMVAMDENMYD